MRANLSRPSPRSSLIVDQNGRAFPLRAVRPRHPLGWPMPGSGPRAYVPYEAASTARERYGWHPPALSADAALLPHLPLMRARSRDAARNGLGAGIIRTLTDYTVGHRGIVRQAKLDPELFGGNEETAREAERQIEAAHRRRTRRCDLGGRLSWAAQQWLACRTWLVDGDAICNLVMAPDGTTRIELIDADRLETPPDKAGNPLVRGGVERDASNVPIAYHIASAHSSDLNVGAIRWVRLQRFNAIGRPNVLHVFEALGVDQSRGAPYGTPSLERLDDFAEYIKAKMYQSRSDAMRSYWIKSDSAYAERVAAGEQDEETGTPIEEVEYGSVNYLRLGEDVVTPENGRPGTELEVFRGAVQAEIGAANGLTLELVSKDFTKTTWHSARQSSLEVMRTVSKLQGLLIDQLVEPFDDIVCEDAILSGEVPLIPPALYWTDPVGFLGHKYQAPVRGLVDPPQETKASADAVEAGLSTLADECAARGKDWQDVIDQRAREKAYAEAKGVELGAPKPAPPASPNASPEEMGPGEDHEMEMEDDDDGA